MGRRVDERRRHLVFLDQVAIFVDAGALVPFISGEFRVDQSLQRIVPVSVRATIGVELRL